MKTKEILLALFVSLFFSLTGIAQNPPQVKVAGIRVIVADRKNKLVAFNTFEKGTALSLLVDAGGASIIKVDIDASKLDSLSDDVGNNLMVGQARLSKNGFNRFPKVSEDGKLAMVEIKSGGVPSKNAGSIIGKGTLVLQTASKKEAVRSKPFDPKKGVKLNVGEIELKVSKAGKPGFGSDPIEIQFETSNKALSMLAGIKFFDAAGEEIKSRTSGSSSMGFGQKVTYTRSFVLKKAVTAVLIVQFEVWTDLVEKKVPFSVTAGIGG